MATEEFLMAGVEAGGDRQDLHERIRVHSQAAGAEVKVRGGQNDLIERLQKDPAFAGCDLASALDARKYIGRAPEQVDAFVTEIVDPVRQRYQADLDQSVEDLKV